MANTARDNLPVAAGSSTELARPQTRELTWRFGSALVGCLVLLALVVSLFLTYQNATSDSPIVEQSTLGQMGVWMAEQSALDAPVSVLGQFTKNQASAQGLPSLDAAAVNSGMRSILVGFSALLVVAGVIGLVGILRGASWSRLCLLVALVGLDILIFVIPVVEGDSTVTRLLASLVVGVLALILAPGKTTKLTGFVVVLSVLLITWETLKVFAQSVDYQITLPQSNWNYTTYETLDESLTALQNGEVKVIIVDRKDVAEFVPSNTEDNSAITSTQYQDLLVISDVDTDTRGLLGLPVIPAFPNRLAVVIQATDASKWKSVNDLINQPVGTYTGAFSQEKYLNLPRNLMLVDLKIFTNLNLPHLQSIMQALLQPARRNGEVLLVRLLSQTALFTWTEAAIGFVSGAVLGFILGAIFAHSKFLERGLLPYVVISQTVPILALAPMVIIWLGAGPIAVAVISAYLTFFPVTINTLRGLTSPHPTALELMQSYAASRWTILWKLRFPAALPYIFTALKVSATTSVVGAIVGELPTGISDGLGGAITNFNQNYSSAPPKLWAAIIIAAVVGIVFFVVVSGIERLVLGNRGQAV